MLRERTVGFTDLQLLKGFNFETYPYAIAKGIDDVVIVDIKQGISTSLIETSHT
jgi:hypothetical protein